MMVATSTSSREARQVSGMEYTLCSFGFGGTNGSLIFKKV